MTTGTFADLLERRLFCGTCLGTGAHSSRLMCVLCRGKGYQSESDVWRNRAYDHYRASLAPRPEAGVPGLRAVS